MNAQNNLDFTKERIRWVITVPAIWTDAAKQFMKEAAVKAGMVDSTISGNLLLALEPEAASICCQDDVMTHSIESSSGQSDHFNSGEQYLVLDLGGGTLDVVVHEVLEDNRLRELCITNGGPIGATQIDTAFIELIDRVTGPTFVSDFKKENPWNFIEFMGSFEMKKRIYLSNEKRRFEITIPSLFCDLCKTKFGLCLEEIITKSKQMGVTFRNGFFILEKEVADGLFSPYISDVISHVKDILQKPSMKDVKKIIAVSGPVESKMIQNALKREFPDHRLIVPKHTWSAVLKGAVQFGHNPTHIHNRITRMTYGCASNRDYIEGVYPAERKVMIEGEAKVKDTFEIFVRRGQTVKLDEKIKSTGNSATTDQQAITERWYATFDTDPKFVDEEGVEGIGRLTIPLPGSGRDRKIETIMWFGDTHIKVQTKDVREGGAVRNIQLDCLTR